jgi:hypothetical protein
MPYEIRLREQARQVVQEGKLPTRAPDRIYGADPVSEPRVLFATSR